MAVFPALELEDKLQIQDKTRFSVTKSFVSSGSDPITTLSVQPGSDESAVNVVAESTQALDWQFNVWNGDFNLENDKIDFNENGTDLVATITTGTYTLTNLAAEIQTQLNAVGSFTYTVSVSDDERLTISATETFSLLPYTGDNRNNSPLIGLGFFSEDTDDQEFSKMTSFQGDRVRWLPKFITVTADNGTDAVAIRRMLKLYSVEGDALFSKDQDLITKKSDIMNWVKDGRNSFINFHRQAQEEIIDWFRGKGFVNIYRDPLRLKDFVKPDDLNQWSVFLTLRLIFDDISNAVDDVFWEEARRFEAREMRLRDRYMRIDLDDDGVADPGEGVNIVSGRIIRR